ncbi:hypothetical protein [Lactococcus lactis]|uniref:hypothetical protein n=1 Tax=Lactococcus lactis TaxID=1358 RepID=UPI0007602FA0|nr:hypothetical protein [Lactococcus lactis]KWT48633.1 hypothetical protein ABB41_04580 [Lactococcus lactis]MDT2852241.1 hypothetical protein [Lactococcus lactis]HAV94295.1 hypothetical protein [Lactococcus lactis]
MKTLKTQEHHSDLRYFFLKNYYLIWQSRLIFIISLVLVTAIHLIKSQWLTPAFLPLCLLALCSFLFYLSTIITATLSNHENYKTLFKSRMQLTKIKRKFFQLEIKTIQKNGAKTTERIPEKYELNKAISRIIVDVRQNNIFVIVPIPKPHVTDEELEALLPAIHKFLSNENLNFSFNAFQRQGNTCWVSKGNLKK